MSLQNSLQNREMNWGPRSDTMSLGYPWILKTCVIIISAVSLAEDSLGRAMKCVILEKRSTTVSTVVLPLDTGSPVTKSMEMFAHGLEGIGRGCRIPIREPDDVLFRAQTEHASTYSQTSDLMAGHQNR